MVLSVRMYNDNVLCGLFGELRVKVVWWAVMSYSCLGSHHPPASSLIRPDNPIWVLRPVWGLGCCWRCGDDPLRPQHWFMPTWPPTPSSSPWPPGGWDWLIHVMKIFQHWKYFIQTSQSKARSVHQLSSLLTPWGSKSADLEPGAEWLRDPRPTWSRCTTITRWEEA